MQFNKPEREKRTGEEERGKRRKGINKIEKGGVAYTFISTKKNSLMVHTHKNSKLGTT